MTLTLDPSRAAPTADQSGQPLVDTLFERLSEAIVTGELAPGSKLSEPRLAARYGVSRAPLREAIRRLEERKLVQRTPRQGVRVVVPSLATAVELFKIREVLEGLAAREAAWLDAAGDPDAALATVRAELAEAGRSAGSEAEIGQLLRAAKGRVALLAAVAEVGGAWSTAQPWESRAASSSGSTSSTGSAVM